MKQVSVRPCNPPLPAPSATACALCTQSKIRRKEALEGELAAIEADIKLLQRGDVVLVVRDS
jgi:hypothetical protein